MQTKPSVQVTQGGRCCVRGLQAAAARRPRALWSTEVLHLCHTSSGESREFRRRLLPKHARSCRECGRANVPGCAEWAVGARPWPLHAVLLFPLFSSASGAAPRRPCRCRLLSLVSALVLAWAPAAAVWPLRRPNARLHAYGARARGRIDQHIDPPVRQ